MIDRKRSAFAGLVVLFALGLTQVAWAQQHEDHATEQGGQGMMSGHGDGGMEHMHHMMGMGGGQQDNGSGGDIFSTIGALVRTLEADPETDWSRIDIEALRIHLVDMHEVSVNAVTAVQQIDGGARYEVTGTGRTLEAIRRMVPAHATQMRSEIDWRIETAVIDGGMELTVTAAEAADTAKIRALGFVGFMTLGEHHEAHHMAIVSAAPASGGNGMNQHSH